MARIRSLTLLIALATLATGIVGGCGASPATPTPPPAPLPTPTPDPHLSPPVSVDALFNKLRKAGLVLYANTADHGANGEPRKRLNLSYEGWPLIIAEYGSARALERETGFQADRLPGEGDPAYTIVGENILVQYGPTSVNKRPRVPDPRWTDAATRLVAILDPWLGPLRQSSLVPLPIATPTPAPTAAPTPTPAPTASPKRTPKPTKKP